MSGEWIPRPYVVGEENVYVVGLQGIVNEVTKTTLTINGTVLPRVMGDETGVRYMSMLWPDADPCDRKHCGPECDPKPADSDAREDLETLAGLIRSEHEERHFSETMRFCNDPICREVYALGVEA